MHVLSGLGDGLLATAGYSLSRLTWPDVLQRVSPESGGGLVFVVPVGSCEQHGPHLPFDVDTEVAEAVTSRLSSRMPSVVLGPALSYGASGEHQGFPGTVSVSHEALATMLVEIGRSASRWAERILFVSGHGGNREALASATARLRGERRDAAWWLCAFRDGDAHAGRTETSLMLALRPASVRLDRAEPGRCEPLDALMPALHSHGVMGVSPNGVLGNPEGAKVIEGAALLDGSTRRLSLGVAMWVVCEDGCLKDSWDDAVAPAQGMPCEAPLSDNGANLSYEG
jgi:mycofactocin system creatininase family protein